MLENSDIFLGFFVSSLVKRNEQHLSKRWNVAGKVLYKLYWADMVNGVVAAANQSLQIWEKTELLPTGPQLNTVLRSGPVLQPLRTA